MSDKKRIVIALGGNALGNNAQEQIELVRQSAPILLSLRDAGHDIVILHGNGPQVGVIQKAFANASEAGVVPDMPLPECGAMSQGYIGYHLQQALQVASAKSGKNYKVASIVTQIAVDPEDPAFKNPTKPIGSFLTKEQADAEKAENPDVVFVEDSGRGYRRVVASPLPSKIVELDSIKTLMDAGHVVVSCGGGGVPVIKKDGDIVGVPAVIDKDFAGERLAEDVDADIFFILTAVDRVAINFGKENEEWLSDLDVETATKLADEGQFGKGSMEPKVRAAIKFASSKPGRRCIIGALDKADLALAGDSGTCIHV